MSVKRKSKAERLPEVVSYRISEATRACLEKFADDNRMGLCEAARVILDAGIEAKGLMA
jgi:hypothetical protein